jgi:hypothetical protein
MRIPSLATEFTQSFSQAQSERQARSVLSIAKLKIARSRTDRAISRRTRIDHRCLGSRGFFWPTSNPCSKVVGIDQRGVRVLRHRAKVIRSRSATRGATDRYWGANGHSNIDCVRSGTRYRPLNGLQRIRRQAGLRLRQERQCPRERSPIIFNRQSTVGSGGLRSSIGRMVESVYHPLDSA